MQMKESAETQRLYLTQEILVLDGENVAKVLLSDEYVDAATLGQTIDVWGWIETTVNDSLHGTSRIVAVSMHHRDTAQPLTEQTASVRPDRVRIRAMQPETEVTAEHHVQQLCSALVPSDLLHTVKHALLLTAASAMGQSGLSCVIATDDSTIVDRLIQSIPTMWHSGVLGMSMGKTADGWAVSGGSAIMVSNGVLVLRHGQLLKKDDIATLREIVEKRQVSVSKPSIGHYSSPFTGAIIVVIETSELASLAKKKPALHALLPLFDMVVELHTDGDIETHARISHAYLEGGCGDNSDIKRVLDNAQTHNPVVSQDASAYLQGYFLASRAVRSYKDSGLTIGAMDSLMRISAAHARLCGMDVVDEHGALVAISLMEESLVALGYGSTLAFRARKNGEPNVPIGPGQHWSWLKRRVSEFCSTHTGRDI